VTPVAGKPGEKIIAYVDNLGRIEGTISRVFDGGFAVHINATDRKRDKFASQLTWLANRNALGLPEDRIHERLIPKNPISNITLPDGRTYPCRVIDMSMGGAAVSIDVRPLIGSEVTLGKMRARVIRHLDNGIALEFSDLQNMQTLTKHFGGAHTVSSAPPESEPIPEGDGVPKGEPVLNGQTQPAGEAAPGQSARAKDNVETPPPSDPNRPDLTAR